MRLTDTNPNEKQVGGDHYKGSGFEPWDLPLEGVGAYEYAAVKYVARYRKKNGLQDLDKAVHYIEKALYHWRRHEWSNKSVISLVKVLNFNRMNQCQEAESSIVLLLCKWERGEDLELAKHMVEELIADVNLEQQMHEAIHAPEDPPPPMPVPEPENIELYTALDSCSAPKESDDYPF